MKMLSTCVDMLKRERDKRAFSVLLTKESHVFARLCRLLKKELSARQKVGETVERKDRKKSGNKKVGKGKS